MRTLPARIALLATGALLGAGAAAPAAWADFGISSFSSSLLNADGSADTQAGSHPYEQVTTFMFNTHPGQGAFGQPATIPDGNVKDIHVALPAGVIVNPGATPRCTVDVMDAYQCPASAQVGELNVYTDGSFGNNGVLPLPVYNMVPPAGVPAELGVKFGNPDVMIDGGVRTGGDYGLTADLTDITALVSITGSQLALWGVPADPSHDAERACPSATGTGQGPLGCASSAAQAPLLTAPTSCGTPLQTSMRADSWQTQGTFMSASASAPAITGCDRLAFGPSISLVPDTTVADSPSGLSVDLHVPQNDDPNGLATANVKDVSVALPAGVSLNPSSADGLKACTPVQSGIDNANEPACPDASKIGSVEVDSPLLPDPLTGGVYVAQQAANPFGSLLAIYVTAEADGALIKLAGHVVTDPVTGQLTTTFSDNPQLPFTDFKLTFFGGARGVLATPDECGTYTSESSISAWSGGSPVDSPSSFAIDIACVAGFSPSFTAGIENPQAGAFSPFVLTISRPDASQELSGLSSVLPPGVLAKLAGVQECSDAQLAAAAASAGVAEQQSPSCPVGSRVGVVDTSAGAGPDPVQIAGGVYLTGPYKGGPYGLAVVVPAVAGPYDLGTVVVRQALYVDPTTAQVSAVSDPFPTILQGIPLRLRSVDVTLDRDQFTLNPTSCDPMAVTGTVTSTGGLSYAASSRFQVGGCAALGFSPKLKVALSGKGRTRSGDHPTLTATLTQPSSQANIRAAKVTLPLSMALDVNNSKNVCNYYTAQAVHGGAVPCRASTIVGHATAATPLLSQPLSGPVYLVQGIRFSHGVAIHTLPSLLVPLRGQIALDLRAQSAVNGSGALVTTFSTIPDAPVSKFTLTVNGGRKGILVITGRGRSICGKSQMADANFGAQSGRPMSSAIRMSTPCRKPGRSKRRTTR